MPIYEYVCSCGAEFERHLPVEDYNEPQECECGLVAKRIISRPMLVKVSEDICYDSPVTGEPITSMKARKEDLAKNECIPYDPGMKQDYHRRIEDSEKQLEKKFDSAIEAEIANMPAVKREKLESELRHNDVDVVRQTANTKPIETDIVR